MGVCWGSVFGPSSYGLRVMLQESPGCAEGDCEVLGSIGGGSSWGGTNEGV